MLGLMPQMEPGQMPRAYAHSFAPLLCSARYALGRDDAKSVQRWRGAISHTAARSQQGVHCAFAEGLQVCQGLTNPWSVRDFGRARAARWLALVSGKRPSRSTWLPCHDTYRVFDTSAAKQQLYHGRAVALNTSNAIGAFSLQHERGPTDFGESPHVTDTAIRIRHETERGVMYRSLFRT
jgi:hypothetical protein